MEEKGLEGEAVDLKSPEVALQEPVVEKQRRAADLEVEETELEVLVGQDLLAVVEKH